MGVYRPPNATWTITLISKWGVIDLNPNATWTYHNIFF